jgi:hypothetical protein
VTAGTPEQHAAAEGGGRPKAAQGDVTQVVATEQNKFKRRR